MKPSSLEKVYGQFVQRSIDQYKDPRLDILVKFRNTSVAALSRRPNQDVCPPTETSEVGDTPDSPPGVSSINPSVPRRPVVPRATTSTRGALSLRRGPALRSTTRSRPTKDVHSKSLIIKQDRVSCRKRSSSLSGSPQGSCNRLPGPRRPDRTFRHQIPAGMVSTPKLGTPPRASVLTRTSATPSTSTPLSGSSIATRRRISGSNGSAKNSPSSKKFSSRADDRKQRSVIDKISSPACKTEIRRLVTTSTSSSVSKPSGGASSLNIKRSPTKRNQSVSLKCPVSHTWTSNQSLDKSLTASVHRKRAAFKNRHMGNTGQLSEGRGTSKFGSSRELGAISRKNSVDNTAPRDIGMMEEHTLKTRPSQGRSRGLGSVGTPSRQRSTGSNVSSKKSNEKCIESAKMHTVPKSTLKRGDSRISPGDHYTPGSNSPGGHYTPGSNSPGGHYTPGSNSPGDHYTPGSNSPGGHYTPGSNSPGDHYTPGTNRRSTSHTDRSACVLLESCELPVIPG
nr:uncharacterized protein LOC123773258 [Procambarus clarkii]